MIGALAVPAVIHGPHLEVLAINHAGKALLADFEAMPPADRNTAKWMFLDPRARVVYRDWARIAAGVVAVLRSGPADDALARLAGELCTRSAEFAALWAEHRVAEPQHGGPGPGYFVSCRTSMPRVLSATYTYFPCQYGAHALASAGR